MMFNWSSSQRAAQRLCGAADLPTSSSSVCPHEAEEQPVSVFVYYGGVEPTLPQGHQRLLL